MEQRYRVLRIIAWIYRILALLAVAGGILVLVFSVTGSSNNVSAGIAALVGGVIGAVILIGAVELIELLLDVEENTRMSAAATRQLLRTLSKEK